MPQGHVKDDYINQRASIPCYIVVLHILVTCNYIFSATCMCNLEAIIERFNQWEPQLSVERISL